VSAGDLTLPPSAAKGFSRRGFLKSVLGAGGAMVVGFELVPGVAWNSAVAGAATAGGSLGVYITIGADETVTLTFPGAEMGQGAATALPMIIAEELMVDWAKVSVVLGGYDPLLNRPASKTNGVWTLGTSQSSGGSNSVRGYHDYLRDLGATARQKLIWAAAAANGLQPADLQAVNGTIVKRADGSSIGTYGQFAADAVSQTPNDVAWVQPPYRYIGQSVPRIDIPKKVNGSAGFGIDVRLPGMLFASVILAPKYGQTLGSYGQVPAGAIAVVPVPGGAVPLAASNTSPPLAQPMAGVAVVTNTTTWQAVKAARSLQVTWVDAPYTANLDSTVMTGRAATLMSTGTAVAASPVVGDADAAIAAAPTTQRYTGTYSVPYINHVTMEPMNATALVTDTSCEIWAPTQVQTKTAEAARLITGLPLSAIKVNNTFLGGGFGRRLQTDFILQAVTVAQAMKGTPVKLVWSREEDFTHDYSRPASLTKLDAAVDAGGNITALKGRVVCPSSKKQNGSLAANTVDSSAVDGIVNALYNFPNKKIEWVLDPVEVPVGSWRSVGNSQNCFFLETFLDEIATGTRQDPIALRRKLLNSGTPTHLRALAVLDALVTASNWNTAPASGRARGMALSMSFGDTIVGEVAEVSGSFTSGFKVQSVTVVIDPGSVINPDTVRAQVESAVNQGLAAAMWQGMKFTSGEPMMKNFNTYRMNRMKDMPPVNTVILQSGAKMGGVGEPALPPIAPAVVNAIAKLTGKRVRNLPIASMLAPSISSFTPAIGPVGTVVTVNGSYFAGVTAVKFNGVAATTFSVVSNSQITATVPVGATTGKITVTTPNGTATSTGTYTVGTVTPTISSLSPTSGPAGTVVTITGTNLSGPTGVTFNGLAATFTAVSATQVKATVPVGATTGPIAITTPNGTATSSTSFTVGTVSTAPTISSLSPTSGTVGTAVAINGANLTGATAVRFNGTTATFTVNSSSKITATVPTGATTGPVTVTTPAGTATSATFTVSTTSSTAPKITSYKPSSGKVGTSVVLGGSNFTGTTSVTFNGVAATFTVNSSIKITTIVPVGATTGKIAVTTPAGTASTSGTYSVG